MPVFLTEKQEEILTLILICIEKFQNGNEIISFKSIKEELKSLEISNSELKFHLLYFLQTNILFKKEGILKINDEVKNDIFTIKNMKGEYENTGKNILTQIVNSLKTKIQRIEELKKLSSELLKLANEIDGLDEKDRLEWKETIKTEDAELRKEHYQSKGENSIILNTLKIIELNFRRIKNLLST